MSLGFRLKGDRGEEIFTIQKEMLDLTGHLFLSGEDEHLTLNSYDKLKIEKIVDKIVGDLKIDKNCLSNHEIISIAVTMQLQEKGKIKRKNLVFEGGEVIESVNGWYAKEQTSDNKISFTKIFDSERIQYLTINGKNIEDLLHEALELEKPKPNNRLSFNDTMSRIIEDLACKSNICPTDLEKEEKLFFISDQVQSLLEIFTIDELKKIKTCDVYNKWQEFYKVYKEDNLEELLGHVILKDDVLMLEKCFSLKKMSEKYYNNQLGKNLLHIAAGCNAEDITAFLLHKKTINIEELDLLGMTPLFIALESRNYGAAALLIGAGSDINKISEKQIKEVANYITARFNNSGVMDYFGTVLDLRLNKAINDDPSVLIEILNASTAEDDNKLVAFVTKLINHSAGFLQDNQKHWDLVSNIINNLPEKKRVLIVKSVISNVDNDSRKARLVNMLSENEKKLASFEKIPENLCSKVYSAIQGITNAIIPGEWATNHHTPVNLPSKNKIKKYK